ncbi:hypothetical protein ACIQAC_29955 [Streptomyces sp. NPDC088387]|uniref:hypothetical protein n=1 Tax=Streptomyces sp. NPDC088387 TaxID=3365859 RepID=UPI00383075B8
MLFGSRATFGLEFHLEGDTSLLRVDIFVGGVHVNRWDNAFYTPLLIRCLGDELRRFRTLTVPPEWFGSPVEAFRMAEGWWIDDTSIGDAPVLEAELTRCEFLQWGECTNEVRAFAFPDGGEIHLGCRIREVSSDPSDPKVWDEPTVVSVNRKAMIETLAQGLAVAEREEAAKRAAWEAQ